MTDIDEQRKKVEELKRKILEQKKTGGASSMIDLSSSNPTTEVNASPAPTPIPVQEAKQPDVVERKHQPEEGIPSGEKNIPRPKVEGSSHTEAEKKSLAPHAVSVVVLQAYAQALKQAWANGSVSQDEENLLQTLRKSLGISEEEHNSLEQEVRLEIYLYAIIDCWKRGALTADDLDRLDTMREKFNISAEEHMRLEKQVRQEILRQH
jgi:hypothetical protein